MDRRCLLVLFLVLQSSVLCYAAEIEADTTDRSDDTKLLCLGPLCEQEGQEGQEGCEPKSKPKDQSNYGSSSSWVDRAKLRVVSRDPLVYAVDNFLSNTEVDAMIELGKQHMHAKWHSKGQWDKILAYEGVFMPNIESMMTEEQLDVEERIARLTGIPRRPSENGMMFSFANPGTHPILRNVHHDKNADEKRTATVLIYLSTTPGHEHGGHTIFPTVPGTTSEKSKKFTSILSRIFSQAFSSGMKILEVVQKTQDTSDNNDGKMWNPRVFKAVSQDCERAKQEDSRSLTVLPQAGTAVVFFSENDDETPDPRTWHAACFPSSGPQRFALQKFKSSKST